MLSGLRGCDLAALKDPDRTPARLPRLEIDVRPHNFHAPLFERVLDIPADLLDGLATGKLVIRAHDATSWRFPELDGCIEIR